MKKLLLFALFLCSFLPTFSQGLTIESFVQTNDVIARDRNVLGSDGEVCAAVIVRIPSDKASFEGGLIIGSPSYKNGEYTLDMQRGAAQMRVSVPGYNTIDVKFRDYIGSTLQSKTTYMLTINMPQPANQPLQKQTLTIKVTPSDAMVQIDGEIIEGNSLSLFVGTHKYNVAARGYHTQEGTIEVRASSPAKLVVELDRKAASSQGSVQTAVSQQPQPVQQPAETTHPVLPVQQPALAVPQPAVSSPDSGGAQTFTVKGVSFTMRPVTGGTFTMGATAEMIGPDGDEKPTHQVMLSSYYMGETEVTQALWTAVMGSNPSRFKGDDLPVESVSWNDCQTFLAKLNALTGRTFRLPTEAEWEYAARGGSKSSGTPYSGSSNLDEVAWYKGNSGSKTHPVKTKKANELGLYDMSGNVWEWCQDWKGSYSSSAQTNPTGPASGSYRVPRGGGWNFDASCCRSSYRFNIAPGDGIYCLGFRLALSE